MRWAAWRDTARDRVSAFPEFVPAATGARVGGRVLVAGVVLATAAACSTSVAGSPVATEIGPPSGAASAVQSLDDLGESGLLRYKGTLTSASGDPVEFDLAAASGGEVSGSLNVNGKAASVLVVERGTYLKAAAEFWATLSGVGNAENKGTAVADRWVKVPGVLIGVELADVFTPESMSQFLVVDTDKAEDAELPLAERKRTDLAGAKVFRVPLVKGAAYLAETAPHGVLKIELDSVGQSASTTVKKLSTTVADATGDLAKFYQDVAAAAGQLSAPVDVLNTVQESGHTFEGCDAAKCSIVVSFTNGTKAAVRVSVRGNWQGDSAPLGACEALAGPVAPGQAGSATCTLSSQEWVQFFAKANSVPGNHPYSVEWSTVVLAEAPDLTKVTALSKAAPADAKAKLTEGSHYVFAIGYGGKKVWKYGVTGKHWTDRADRQLAVCMGATRSVCRVDLVTATGDAGSAYGLLKQLVDAYRAAGGECPAGQWAGCAR
ncbi:hypothetical protein [Actinokineospora globicatena]|uniref:hypothetical protein n=1 Tax=Actinokineospora globicatena TaxID=103729 RepID=UPI0020A467EA|nr:hypothetical protein [Actinokineospora globicatena]MCP2302547.1 hypothetical protein [Actinokineospora globicatena]GLW75766.1 hypothetical protein Aglo01_02480 [Actinokineospora globicatena]GLW82606.1 hypothetical protein Aglo02_02470 [Actinokineospora globicatena]